MRQILEERGFPVGDIRFFASARSAGTVLPYAGPRDRRGGRRHRRPERPRRRAVLRRRDHLARARAGVRRRGSGRGRQLQRLPQGPGDPAGRLRGQPGGRRRRASPPGTASSPTPTARPWPSCRCSSRCTTRPASSRLIVSTYQAVSGSGVAGVEELASQVAAAGDKARRAGVRRRGGRVPGAAEVRAHDRLQRAADGGLDRRRRPRGDRRGAEAPQRVPQDPRHPRPQGVRHLRPGAGLHRPLAGDQRRVRAGADPGPGPRDPRGRPRRRALRRPDPAPGRRQGPVLRRPDPPGPGRRRRPRAGAVRLRRQPAQGRRPQHHPDRGAASLSGCDGTSRRPRATTRAGPAPRTSPSPSATAGTSRPTPAG